MKTAGIDALTTAKVSNYRLLKKMDRQLVCPGGSSIYLVNLLFVCERGKEMFCSKVYRLISPLKYVTYPVGMSVFAFLCVKHHLLKLQLVNGHKIFPCKFYLRYLKGAEKSQRQKFAHDYFY